MIERSCRLSRFNLGFNHGTMFGFTRFPQILQQRIRLFSDIYMQNTSRIVTGLFHGSITTEYSRFSTLCQSTLFLSKQAFLLGISTRVVCRNTSLNHSGGLYLISPNVPQCKFYGGPLCLQLVTSNHKLEETITMQTFAYFEAYFNALMNFKILKNIYFIILLFN